MRRALASLAVVLCAVALASGRAFADPPPASPPAAAPAPRRSLTADERAKLLPLLRAYLEFDSSSAFRARIELREAMRKLKNTGCDVLADVDALRAMLYETRPFLPPLDRKAMDAGRDDEIRDDASSGVLSVKRGTLRLGISLPQACKEALARKTAGATPPFPLIVVLHDGDDYEDAKRAKPWPGEEAIKRLYPKATTNDVTDAWIVFAPVATKARFSEGGAVLAERVPLVEIWKRYPVDFERMVIDGGPDALLFAAAYPTYYAGVIVRGDATDVSPDVVPNLGSTFVYVVQTGDKVPPVVETLRRAGHPASKLAVGPPSGLGAWLAGVKRVPPKAFRWVVKDNAAHRLAQWINIEAIDEAAPLRTLDVEIVDTKEDPNTVRIEAVGIRGISIFLNDTLVDLDREVRVVVNGRPVEECQVEAIKPEDSRVRLPAKFARTIDGMFDSRRVSIRKSMFYGWLFPVTLDIAIESDAPPVSAVDASAAQRAFAVGDLELRRGEAVESFDPVAQAIAWVRDTYWRPRLDAPPPDYRADDPARARAAWLISAVIAARTRHPEPATGTQPQPDPLPVLSGLVLDRIRREQLGRHSTREQGPLAAVASDESIGWFLDEWVPGAYGGPGAVHNRDLEAERVQARELRDTASRNRWLGAGAVAGLLALAAVGGLVAGRRRPDADGRTSGAPAGGESDPSPGSHSGPPTRSGD